MRGAASPCSHTTTTASRRSPRALVLLKKASGHYRPNPQLDQHLLHAAWVPGTLLAAGDTAMNETSS